MTTTTELALPTEQGDGPTVPQRVYISGPMTGYPQYNAPAFAEAADWATAQGWTAVNPHDVRPAHDGPCPDGERIPTLDGAESHPYGCFMRADLAAMLTCDTIVLLPGWEASPGANAELDVATICGLKVVHFAPAGAPV